MTISILLVDDQMLIREGIKSLLGLSDKVTVIGEASDGESAIRAIEELKPDLVLMDISMPKLDGIQALQMLQERSSTIPVILLTTFDDPKLVMRGMQAGAKGFLLKDVSLDFLIEGIETVAKGETLLQPAITERLLQGLQGFKGAANGFSAPEPVENLTAKEKEILRLMASGYSNKEISTALHKSEGTVKNHISNILSKLNVRDRTRAVLLAIEKSLI
jgi:DNA-binding NarL/FixJ family response regulator